MTDEPLIDLLRAGDDAAYRRLVETHGPRMLAVIRRYCRDAADANDALQDAFVSVFKGIGSFRSESSLSTWLHTIAVRCALMKLRQRKRHRKEQLIDDLLPHFDGTGHRENVGPAWDETALKVLQRRETRQAVRDLIERLPETHRQVLMMRDLDGLDTAESAALLRISVEATKVRLHRARQALRELLEKHLVLADGEAT